MCEVGPLLRAKKKDSNFDGKTVNSNVAELVEEHGIQAYPFTPEKLEEIAEIERKRLESLTLESLLVSGERDFFIGKDGIKV
ncbi:putative nucleoredoxin 1 [Cinnamomum micranthum f. kanehirae]|uniref:Putative nucleoredoxin 1 n=1 Tax=Cinnamomum micranthum f. kanehirae TaxID=337451 RepID=A0A443P351_9MAGN|nr:putative nucleoredoxin 1 [Cinnamomum micranthum f. kanehirae]